MTNEKEMTKEEAYEQFPFLKKLDDQERRDLMVSILVMLLKGPKNNDCVIHALQVLMTRKD